MAIHRIVLSAFTRVELSLIRDTITGIYMENRAAHEIVQLVFQVGDIDRTIKVAEVTSLCDLMGECKDLTIQALGINLIHAFPTLLMASATQGQRVCMATCKPVIDNIEFSMGALYWDALERVTLLKRSPAFNPAAEAKDIDAWIASIDAISTAERAKDVGLLDYVATNDVDAMRHLRELIPERV